MPLLQAGVHGLTLLGILVATRPASGQDPLADELARWRDFLATADPAHESLAQLRGAAGRELGTAQQALAQGRRLAALYRLALVRGNLGAVAFQLERTGGKPADEATLDQAHRAAGEALAPLLAPPTSADFATLRPAAVRALAEAAAPHVRGYYLASRDYGRATFPDAGMLYLGAAHAERDFIAFARGLGQTPAGDDLTLRPLAADIAGLAREMLAAYRPPLSLDRHQEFVAAHGALDEARDLDAAGLRHGALLRYLQAAIRFATLQPPTTPPDRDQLIASLTAARPADDDPADHSIARMFLEVADVELAAKAPTEPTPAALAIALAALPRYRQALAPAATPTTVPPVPELTVTLVRWPYA